MILNPQGKPTSALQERDPCPYCGSKREPKKIRGFGRHYTEQCQDCSNAIGKGRDREVQGV